jgi:hypothetical protein
VGAIRSGHQDYKEACPNPIERSFQTVANPTVWAVDTTAQSNCLREEIRNLLADPALLAK